MSLALTIVPGCVEDMKVPDISKSKYLAGLQCPKLLWIYYNAKDQIPAPDVATQVIFNQGHEVGRLAQSLFPGGTEVPWSADLGAMQAQCSELLALRRPIYEATFSADGILARADILNPVENNRWDVIEVKSCTKVKGVHIPDLAVQRFCYEGAGVSVRRCHLMHVNNRYVRRGAVEAKGLFTVDDVSDAVAANLPEVAGKVAEMRRVISSETCPVVAVGSHCDNPYPCPLRERCWAEKWKAEAAAKPVGEPQCDRGMLRKFLDGLVYPLYLLDFETIATAIPLFDECRPYEKVPFQFSLHVVERLDAEPRHVSWLWDGQGDPRKAMFDGLRREIGPRGSVVAYGKSFEEGCLNESAKAIPEHAGWVDALMPRMVDLGAPVRSHAIRHPALGKRQWSLKRVLPLLTDRGYDDLAIGDGNTASAEFLRVMYMDATPEDRSTVRRNLEEYCGQDTGGMLDILRRLEGMARR